MHREKLFQISNIRLEGCSEEHLWLYIKPAGALPSAKHPPALGVTYSTR